MAIFRSIDRGIHRISNWLSWVSMAVILLMMLVIAADVILRYFFDSPIEGSVDFIEVSLPVLGFFAIAYAQLTKSHVRVNLVLSRFSGRHQGIFDAITRFIAMLLYLAVAWQVGLRGWEYIFDSYSPRTLGIQIIIWPFLMVACVGFFMLSLELLTDFCHSVAQATGKEESKEEAVPS